MVAHSCKTRCGGEEQKRQKAIMFIIVDNKCNNVYNSKHKRCITMNKNTYNIMPATQEILKTMGEQIKLARLRRNLSTELIAERAGVSRASLWKVEKGDPSVAIGIYAAVLHALNNMDKELLKIAKDDMLGRKLQDLELSTRRRATRRERS